ncbi:MAG: glycoside hydrolase family 2 protein, partial [Butyrivibrio sp.]|nr:glycoside hydrolase family 2 protein [Butyrivibrio sp.]
MDKICFDEDWKYIEADLKPQFPEDGWGGAKAGAYVSGATSVDCDMSLWSDIKLPHDFVIDGEHIQNIDTKGINDIPAMQTVQSRLHAGGSIVPGICWYRKSFRLKEEYKNKRIYIIFEGVYRDCDLYLNQNYVGSHDSGYTHFFYDITDFIREDDENIIAMRVDAMGREGWWYEGGGIYKHVWLYICDDILIEPYDLHIEPVVSEDLKKGTLKISASVISRRVTCAKAALICKVYDKSDKEIATMEKSFTIESWDRVNIKMEKDIPDENLHLWGLKERYLYKIKTFIVSDLDEKITNTEKTGADKIFSDNKTSSEVIEKNDYAEYFGFRKIKFTADNGFFLNGEHVLIKGLCTHHDHAGVGIGLDDSVLEYRLREMKKCGMNALRSAHGEPSDIVLEICDRLGILVLSETRRMGSAPVDIESMKCVVKQGRNHPSVILWGIGNEEVNVQMKKETAKTVRSLRQEIRLLDKDRPVTYALVCWDGDTHYETAETFFGTTRELDVMGFNYSVPAWDHYHENNPTQPMIITENNAANSSTRGCYETVEADGHFFTLDPDNRQKCTSKGAAGRFEKGEDQCREAFKRDYMAGMFLWTGIDYHGEPTPMPWPAVNSQFGIMDMCGFRKDAFYYYKAWWNDEDFIHVFPHWNLKGREGEKINVYVYTNADEAEIFVNGKSFGRQKNDRFWYMTFKNVTYEPGELKAVSYKNGKVVQPKIVETTGEFDHVIVEEYLENSIAADDIHIYNIKAVDRDGRFVPTVDKLLKFSLDCGKEIEKESKIIGV